MYVYNMRCLKNALLTPIYKTTCLCVRVCVYRASSHVFMLAAAAAHV